MQGSVAKCSIGNGQVSASSLRKMCVEGRGGRTVSKDGWDKLAKCFGLGFLGRKEGSGSTWSKPRLAHSSEWGSGGECG